MSEQENTRQIIEMWIGFLADSEEARVTTEDSLKLIKNQVTMLGSDAAQSDIVIAAIEANHSDLSNIRRRNKIIRDQLESWWRNV